MVNFCCVAECKNEYYPGCGFSFHRFPRDESMREKWSKVVPGKIVKTSLVCSKKFEVQDYDSTSRKILKSHARPFFQRSCRGVCGTCRPISKEFKKILNLKDSGLTIYVHKDEENQKPSATDKKQDKILLHNTTDKDLKRSDYIKELSKYKTQCFRCNTVLQQIHGLLDEVKEIRENEVRVVCQYCKAQNVTGQCSRCNYLVNKFMTDKVKEYDKRIQRFGEWLSKVKHILHAILEESNRAKGKSTIQQDLASSDELERLLLELKTPLKITSRQPQIRQLLEKQSVSSAASIAESEEILELLLDRLKTVTKPDFKPEEEVKSGSSSITLPPIKTVFKVLPKKSVDSAFTLLPPSSEMLSSRPLLKGTVPIKKQTQFVERDRDIDRARSRYPKQGRGKVQTSGIIARPQAEHDVEPSKELIIHEKLERKDKKDLDGKKKKEGMKEDSKMDVLRRISRTHPERDAKEGMKEDSKTDVLRRIDRTRAEWDTKEGIKEDSKMDVLRRISRTHAERDAKEGMKEDSNMEELKRVARTQAERDAKERMKKDPEMEDLTRIARKQAEKDAKEGMKEDSKMEVLRTTSRTQAERDAKKGMKEDSKMEVHRIIPRTQAEWDAKEGMKEDSEMEVIKRIARTQAERDAKRAEELDNKEKELMKEESGKNSIGQISRLQTQQGAERSIELDKEKDKNKISEGKWPREPLHEKSSSDILLKKEEFKRHAVEDARETKSLTRLEELEIPKERKRSKTYVAKIPIFSIGIVNKNGETLPPTALEDDQNQMRISSSQFVGIRKIGKKGRYEKGSKKIFKTADKGKLKGKKKRTRSDGSESDESDISDIEYRKKSTSKGLKKKTGQSPKEKSKDKKKRARSDGSESDESEISDKENRKKSPSKPTQLKRSASTKLLIKLLKQREKEKRKDEKSSKMKQKEIKMPFFAKLPEVKYTKRRTDFGDFGGRVSTSTAVEAIVKCESDIESFEMIKGTKVIPYDRHYKDEQPEGVVQPLLFRKQPVCHTPPDVKKSLPTIPDQPTDSKKVVTDIFDLWEQSEELKGVLKYALSNRDFIENGYTLLPTVKLMRKEHVYKMIPAHPENDWFERHKQQRLFYETGEKLAEIDQDGHGRWYYKNGILALNYYKAEEVNAGHRYVIYSSGLSDSLDQDLDHERKHEPITVLASFDHNGNGVVYDQKGNVRIKYNQTEGIVMDKKIGPIARWKWHDMNDPPVIKPLFVDNYLEEPGVCLENFLKEPISDTHKSEVQLITENSRRMLDIELENFSKDKAHKILQKYKPFQIRMKALRINKEFSLKVLDQGNIYILFRSGHVTFKLNVGMVLISNEILDTDIMEATQILTPYDRVLPRSESVADIKRILQVTRKRNQRRKDKFPERVLSHRMTLLMR